MFVQLKQDYLGQRAGARIDVDPPVAEALITQEVAEAVPGDALVPVLAKSAEALLANLTTTLNRAVDSALKDFAAAQGKSRRNAAPVVFGPGGAGDPKRTFGAFPS